MQRIEIKKEDVLKSIYFITTIVQAQNGNSMQGALSSKGDLMGGIFDRWINIIPESLILNKVILSDIDNTKEISIISDFYAYNPKDAGIAPDVIGITVDKKIIPFAVFDNKWIPVPRMPQIEVKTFKKQQKMVSLRNQGYESEYLIMTETDLRIDYLLPFFSDEIFSDNIYNQLRMNDSIFIKSDTNGRISQAHKVIKENNSLGYVQLLKITTAEEFMECSTFCESNVSIQYISKIEEMNSKPRGIKQDKLIYLSDMCDKTKCGLYRFNQNMYDGITEDNIPYFLKNKNSEFLCKVLDISCDNIDKITIVKKSKSTMYIISDVDVKLNEQKIIANKYYKITFTNLDRSGNNVTEYFMQKELISFIKDYKDELKKDISKVILGVN